MPDVVALYKRFGVRLPNLHTDGWVSCRCFAGGHQDRHPSARVNLRSGGFRCFACGVRGGALDALQLLGVHDRDEARRIAVDYGILEPQSIRKKPRLAPVKMPPTPVKKLVQTPGRIDYDNLSQKPVINLDRTWTYVDKDGAAVGRVRRLDMGDGTKRIWQERPDGDDWAAGLEGKTLPLYQLPLVLAAAQQQRRILIVEGEKAVAALERIGVLASTNAGGAGKWRPEHTLALLGAITVVVCDCDGPGRLHAKEVSASLLDAGVSVLVPYDPAPLRRDGYDVVDQLTETAEAERAVAPRISDDLLRSKLRERLEKLIGRQLPADHDSLERWHEHAQYLTDPHGRTYLRCPRCGQEHVHQVSHGLAYCRCGHHQPVPETG